MATIFEQGSVVDSTVIDITTVDHVQNFDLIYIGTAGDLKVIPIQTGAERLFKNVPVGWFPVAITTVVRTGTTAADMQGCNLIKK